VGILAPHDYREFVLPHTKIIFDRLSDLNLPTIHFGTGTAMLLELMREAGGDVISVDWRVPLDIAWERIGYNRGIQGNLDPARLVAPWERIDAGVRDVLRRASGRPGHIFNLGHGVPAETPYENLTRIVRLVHDLTGAAEGAR
jgi:uroporphyrinogen decarboxylase